MQDEIIEAYEDLSEAPPDPPNRFDELTFFPPQGDSRY
jgi:hypothetical protein